MSAAHLSNTFTKELERAAYKELPAGVTREALRHEVAVSGAGGVVRNLIYVARLSLYKLAVGKKPPYPVPPDLTSAEIAHLDRCAARIVAALTNEVRDAA